MKDCNVLVVDGNRDAADSTKILLEMHGSYVVRVAYSFADVKEVLNNGYKPDVLLTELNLLGGSGCAVAEYIREKHQNCKFVALTGYGRQKDRDSTAAAGFDFHLIKPVDPQYLESIVRHECQNIHHCSLE